MVKFSNIKKVTKKQKEYLRSLPEYAEMLNRYDDLYVAYQELTEHNAEILPNEDGTYYITAQTLYNITAARHELNVQITTMNRFVATEIFHYEGIENKDIENIINKSTGLNILIVDRDFECKECMV